MTDWQTKIRERLAATENKDSILPEMYADFLHFYKADTAHLLETLEVKDAALVMAIGACEKEKSAGSILFKMVLEEALKFDPTAGKEEK